MDRPMGPRQDPDKRHVAYESLFPSRPPQSHPQPQHYNQPISPPEYNQPYPYPPQQFQGNGTRRTSYNPPNTHTLLHQPDPPQPYRQSYNPPQNQFPPPNAYYNPGPPVQYHHAPNLAPHNPMLSRARSMAGPQQSRGFVPPQMFESQHPSMSAPPHVSQPNFPPNNSYPGAPQPEWSRPRGSPGPSDRNSFPQDHQRSTSHEPPRLGITLEHDDGRLGIDFVEPNGGGNGNSSDHESEDSSELPWVRKDSPVLRSKSRTQPTKHQNSHARQPSLNHALHIDTSSIQGPQHSVSHSPSSSNLTDSTTLVARPSQKSARRSSDSNRTTPRLQAHGRDRTNQDRAMSMSAATSPIRTVLEQKHVSRTANHSPHLEGRNSPVSIRVPTRRTPVVYPALLSRVAEAFRDRIQLSDRIKDGLTYKNAFDGREAVDKIAYIIKTTDRNLALLLGRALDAQKFFHDVTYDHRLRDNSGELYQFQTKLPSPFVSGELPQAELETNGHGRTTAEAGSSTLESSAEDKDHSSTPSPSGTPPNQLTPDATTFDEVILPSGVFTLLTDCYSPTCSRDRLCYSIACPRRLEQQARLNMKPQPGLSKQISKESLGDVPDDGTLWIHSVPAEIASHLSDSEKKRQEAINEVIYTERDFVRDMEYLRDCWVQRLKEDDCIPPERRAKFLTHVFWNIQEIIAVNTRLRDALSKRQKHYAIVEGIGDLMIEAIPNFGPFVSYGAHQLYGKYEFEKEKSSNPAFAQFVETTERLPESRKLELNAYLTKPTTRLARYPLLLGAVLKHTPDGTPEKANLNQAVTLVKEFLAKVNTESGRTENRFNLVQLDQQLFFKPGEEVDLRLQEEGREMVHRGPLNKRDGELQVYLFDHALLFTKFAKTKTFEQYKVYRRPIPLELLMISASEDATNPKRPRQALIKKNSFNNGRSTSSNPQSQVRGEKGQFWINFIHLGRKYYNLMLWANSALAQRKWLDSIVKQQQVMRERSMIFDAVPLSEGYFSGPNKVNCAAPYGGGRQIVYGTDDGVYIQDFQDHRRDGPIKVLALVDVVQVDVLEDYQLLIVLSERQVISFPLDALDPHDPMAGLKRAKRISSHTSFFKAGFCLGRVLVCIVKSSQLSSTFKTLEPIDQNIRGRNKPTFRKLLQGGNDTLKLFKEFYIPIDSTSIHYLKTKMCVGGTKGFEIVDLETLDRQGLLDPNDESLEFVRKREHLRPMSIYRIHNEFLLCYDEFAFYVNRNGRRSRPDFLIQWEGQPTGFALHEPYVLALEPSFVEIRHIETGLLSQVIQGTNLRLLFADTPPSVTNGFGAAYQVPPPPNQLGYNGYPNSPVGSINRGGSPSYGGYPYQQPHPQQQFGVQTPTRNPQGIGRDEILIVSDDRVLALRTASGPQRYMSDNSSMRSVNR